MGVFPDVDANVEGVYVVAELNVVVGVGVYVAEGVWLYAVEE